MRHRGSVVALLGTVLALGAFASSAAAKPASYTVKTLHFDVTVGPQNDTHCNVVGDLYKPKSASRKHRVPAILTTNGFGGSKDDQAALGKWAASHGYAVLSYSGLGFGGSGCKIYLDDRAYDGKAAKQLVTFLGGGMKANDGTKVDFVKHDRRGSDGRHHRFDPRVGMIGGSYGGQIQFAAAGIDPRIDTIIPIITWNDLSYSLAPNNTSLRHGVSYRTPGIEKFEWTSLFFGLGIADGVGGVSDPSRNVGCPNFDNRACTSKAQMDALGYPDATTIGLARHASVTSFMKRIRIPTMLMQGQGDTLFNLQESVATYRALRQQHTPVRLVWQSWGHSTSTPAPGEYSESNPPKTYEGRLIVRWFNHYLKRKGPKPRMDFRYFRDWVHYHGIATPAYAKAKRYPVGHGRRYLLSGSGSLVRRASKVQSGQATFSAAAGPATSYTETSAFDQSQPVTDAPGTFAQFSTGALKRNLTVVGSPKVRVRVDDPVVAAGQSSDPAAHLVLFFKLYDIQPDGTVILPHRLIAPVRVTDVTKPFTVQLPGIVHRFPKGDRISLTVAGSDLAYKGNDATSSVSILADPGKPGSLTLPVVGRRSR
jgi:ABC-2 type transport system ATP-binding protein